MNANTANGASFKVQFEGAPEKPPVYQAILFSGNGKKIFQSIVESDAFTISVDAARFRGARLFLLPLPPDRKENEISLTQAIDQAGSHEIILPADLQKDIQITTTVPEITWNYWFFCRCHVRGRVLNLCTGEYLPVMHARIHICEVDPLWWQLTRLPDQEILRIRDELLEKITLKIPVPPIPDPGPITPAVITRSLPQNAPQPSALKIESESHGDQPMQPHVYPVDLLPKENLMAFYSDSASSVRAYFLQHYKLLTPIWCWIQGLFLHCDEISVVQTNESGWFETDIWYGCFGDHPDLYFWAEYNINGVWTTVYHPAIGCHTYWNYTCNSEVDIYLNDDRIPCPSNPTVPGKVVIVTTLGNNVSVSRVDQSGADRGLSDRIYHPDALGGPFGGTIEPHVIFGEDLLSGSNPVKYYRWSYARDGGAEWHFMPHAVTRHYLHIEIIGGIPFPSFPVYSLGPDINGIMEIQSPRNPVTNDPWAILDARADTATAFFETQKEKLGIDPVHSEYYKLKLELFHADKSRVDFTAEGISLFMPDASEEGPFGQDPITTVPIDASHNSDYQYLDEITGNFSGFKMVIRVDNNGTSAVINETWVDNSANKAGECGMIPYADKGTSEAHLSFRAKHPFDFAWFGFNIYKGSSGFVHSVSRNVNNTPPVPAMDRNPVPPPSYLPSTEAYAFDHSTWQFDTDKPVQKLLDNCNEAAFAETLNVYATATDGWSRLGYDSSDVKAFALKH